MFKRFRKWWTTGNRIERLTVRVVAYQAIIQGMRNVQVTLLIDGNQADAKALQTRIEWYKRRIARCKPFIK